MNCSNPDVDSLCCISFIESINKEVIKWDPSGDRKWVRPKPDFAETLNNTKQIFGQDDFDKMVTDFFNNNLGGKLKAIYHTLEKDTQKKEQEGQGVSKGTMLSTDNIMKLIADNHSGVVRRYGKSPN